jgi:hypothetical protein
LEHAFTPFRHDHFSGAFGFARRAVSGALKATLGCLSTSPETEVAAVSAADHSTARIVSGIRHLDDAATAAPVEEITAPGVAADLAQGAVATSGVGVSPATFPDGFFPLNRHLS